MKLIVWYHAVLSGPRIPSHDNALAIVAEQMVALKNSGLSDGCDEFHIGVNGDAGDCLEVLSLAPSDHVIPQCHQFKDGQSELSTLHCLRRSLTPGRFILYHHIKGVQYPGNPVWANCRHCMERTCVWNWRDCVNALEQGIDTCGAHWMTNLKYPMIPIGQRYWGGNFWWATSDYLMTLPNLHADTHENRYEAEVWIGKGVKNLSVRDLAPHFPMNCPP